MPYLIRRRTVATLAAGSLGLSLFWAAAAVAGSLEPAARHDPSGPGLVIKVPAPARPLCDPGSVTASLPS
ncbi:hypothetical protein [Actinoplanes auranticolor]|uniref:Uncharacterized protein n=1 Tax=Actinoplanes auranticolor TaxID=47988 RepID=A0A919S8C2_9ACTN|nr:hypothetical protein [Actinoplanes auranticolor]GIM66581.1 hypothetical protein Aau02nite_23480 [Actinoplanes auranticolor]